MGRKKKKEKGRKPLLWGICLVVLTFVVAGGFWLFSKYSGGKVDADTAITSVDNQTGNNGKEKREILTVHSSFYNYRYDDEMISGKRTQGSQSSDNQYETPYGIFNQKLNWYYTQESFGKGIDVGIYMGNFYWYWKDKITASTSTLRYNWDWCLKNYCNFYWAANIANRYGEETNTATYAATCQGIVDESLMNFDKNADPKTNYTGTLTNNGKAVPFFNKAFLDWTWDSKENTTTIGAYAEDVGFPFRAEYSKEKGNYYVFDSTKDVVRFKGMETGDATQSAYYFGSNKQLEYYYEEKQISFKTSDEQEEEKSYFFPFNNAESVVRDTKNNNNNLDYGFGARFDIPFYLTANGMQDDDGEEKPMKFNFSGDDDVWIFLDGELVLDLGGQHGAATGYIDFSQKIAVVEEVSYLGATGTNTTAKSHCFETNNTHTAKLEKNITAGEGDHVLTVFYLERGMIESNLYMDFSFIPHDAEKPTVTTTPSPTPTTPVSGTENTTLNVENDVKFDNVNSNSEFLNDVMDVVEDDGFRYKLQNKGTKTTDVGDSGLAYPSGVLSVRKNRGKTRYWSFGEKPTVRVYFDLTTAQNNTKLNSSNTWGNAVYIIIKNTSGEQVKQMTQYTEKDGKKYYYYDVPLDSQVRFRNRENNDNPKLEVNNFQGIVNGRLFTVSGYENGNSTGTTVSFKFDDTTFASESSTTIEYSNNLPYQTKTTPAPTYAPDDTNALLKYSLVSDTAYQLFEFYTAAPDSSILNNSAETTRKTDSSGVLSLLSEDSGSFIKQFKVGSSMKIVQQQNLATVKDKVPSGTGDDGDDYVSEYEEGSRDSYDYYHTTVTAKDANGGEVTVNNKGEFVLANTVTGSATKVEVTETFTHTVKTGSIVLEKKLAGCTDTDAEYTFTVTVKNIFGGSTPTDYTPYELSYKLYTQDSDGKYQEDANTYTLSSEGTLILKANQKAVISGIPVGTAYKIQETDSTSTVKTIASSIKVTYDTTTSDGTILSGSGSGETIQTGEEAYIEGTIPTQVKAGSITSKEFEKVEVGITFTNQAGVLKITKYVIGEWDGTEDKYMFTIKANNNQSLEGKAYKIYEESANTGGSYGASTSVIVSSEKLGDNQQISLKAGQWAEISDLPINKDNEYTYTITEEKGYYDLAEILVKRGTGTVKVDDESNPISVVTAELNGDNPQVDVVFSNEYSSYYIDVEKYVDKLYYTGDEYLYNSSDDNQASYQELSGAKQSFIFKIEEYKDSDCKEPTGKAFDITMSITDDNLLDDSVIDNGITYNYRGSQRILVTPGMYYKITEDTGWSWKYALQNIEASYNGTRLAKDDAVNKVVTNDSVEAVILNGYRKNEDDKVPTAKFYNKRDTSKEDIEGDTDNIPNKITKE